MHAQTHTQVLYLISYSAVQMYEAFYYNAEYVGGVI